MKLGVRTAWAFVALGCAACAAQSGEAHPAPAAPPGAAIDAARSRSTEAPTKPPDATLEDRQRQTHVAEALARVARARQLAALGPVTSHVIPRRELADRMRREVLSDLDPALLEGGSESLFLLGAASADLDYEKSILELLGSQLAGFYDPREKALFWLDDLGQAGEEATLWHELVHALQDQHYDLAPRLKWSPGRGDALAAVQSLAEGDATSAMLDLMLAGDGRTALDVPVSALASGMGLIEAMPEIADVPAILKRSVVAPYVDGVAFVHALRRLGGWAAVDAAWKDPPTTTEQVLHPEKYLAHEAAARVPQPVPPAEGPRDVLVADVLGEQALRLALEEWLPAVTAAEAAAGWGGDQQVVFATGDRRAFALRFAFDDTTHAAGAFTALVRGALAGEPEERRAGTAASPTAQGAEKAARGGSVCRERARRGPFAVLRRGRDVAVTLGPYRRQRGVTESDATCRQALAWAARILAAK